MSLATLKSKIELLIHKATFGNIYEKIFKTKPLDLVVPDGVTVLCADQNIMYAPLTTVSASGADVEEITEQFFMSTNIESVNFPKLKIINNECFMSCSSLTEINAPMLTTIGDRAFGICSSLTEINAPMVTSIGEEAILSSTKISKITVGTLTSAINTSFKPTSRGHYALAEIYIGDGTSADLYWQYSDKYTQEVLHLAIEHLADKTGMTAGNFVVGTKNIEKIDAEHIAMLENKNWIYQ